MNELVGSVVWILAVLLVLPVLVAIAFPEELVLLADLMSERRGRRSPTRQEVLRGPPRRRTDHACPEHRRANVRSTTARFHHWWPGSAGDAEGREPASTPGDDQPGAHRGGEQVLAVVDAVMHSDRPDEPEGHDAADREPQPPRGQ